MAHRQSNQEETGLVEYAEPEVYYDEPPDYGGRTGVRGDEQEVDYSIYATRKETYVHRNPDRDRCRKICFGICIVFWCCLLIAGLIAAIILVLHDVDDDITFAPTISPQPTFIPINPPTFPPTIDTRPTTSPKPTTTFLPSQVPSVEPSTSPPTRSSQPSGEAELLSVLGEEDDVLERTSLDPFGFQHSFIVNDQGVYEFVMEFTHNENMPIGDDNWEGDCENQSPTKIHYYDERPFREPRRHFRRLPDYVWQATGFQHLSLDWNPCGTYPRNFASPHYDFSFYRVRPEYRAYHMTCVELLENEVAEPDIVRACRDDKSQTLDGKEFHIVPASVFERLKVPNMPREFSQAEFYAAKPYDGLRYYNVANQPSNPRTWDDLDLWMSTFEGDLLMWQAKVPFRIISGPDEQFNSKTFEYYQNTIETLPDAYSVHYTADARIRFQMTGKSAISKAELDILKLDNPDDLPSARVPLPSPPECVCIPPEPSPQPSAVPSVEPSLFPTIPRFDFCSLFTGSEPNSNVVINCFSEDYDCNENNINDCHLECGPDQCMSSRFSQSFVQCIDDSSCNRFAEGKRVAQFSSSQVLCQETGSCTDAEFLECTCCDGNGCPDTDIDGNGLISCIDGDLEAFCDRVINTQNGEKTCRELGNPVCTNMAP